eukprot:Pgem_evm1s8269
MPVHTTNMYSASALSNASITGKLEVVKLLIENGVTEGIEDENLNLEAEAFPQACANGHLEIVKLIYQAGFRFKPKCLNANSITEILPPLVGASANGHLPVVQYLIEEGLDVNYSFSRNYASSYGDQSNGHTPLTIACFNGHFEVVKTLVSAGADVNKCGKHGDNPLFLAKRFKYHLIADYLIEQGALTDTTKGKINVAAKFKHLDQHLDQGPHSMVKDSRENGDVFN